VPDPHGRQTSALARAVKIDLDHEHYAALIVEVADPEETVAAINAAIAALPSREPAH
jgi:hypothetical protein